MVHFMLDCHRLKPFSLQFSHVSRLVGKANPYPRRSLDISCIVRNAHAPLTHGGDALGHKEFRVYQRQHAMIAFPAKLALRNIYHADPEIHANLRSGHTDRTGASLHGVNKVGNKVRDFPIDSLNRSAHLFEKRMGEVQYRAG